MTSKELKVFDNMPFLFWVKNSEGVYIFANQQIRKLAEGEIIGKTDYELPWAKDADKLREADKEVLDTGKTQYIHEFVDESGRGRIKLNVCKFAEDFEGERCAFGISFEVK